MNTRSTIYIISLYMRRPPETCLPAVSTVCQKAGWLTELLAVERARPRAKAGLSRKAHVDF